MCQLHDREVVALPYFIFIVAQTPTSSQGFGAIQLGMLGAGIIGLTIVMRSTAKRIRTSREPSSPARKRYAKMSQELQAKRDLESVMVELDELARQIHGRIDTKFAKLELVIRDADARIAQLSRLTSASRQSSSLDVTVADNAPTYASKPTPKKPSPPGATPHMHAEVYRLADAGICPVDIAAKVGRMTGEVELILSLRKTQRQASGASTAKK